MVQAIRRLRQQRIEIRWRLFAVPQLCYDGDIGTGRAKEQGSAPDFHQMKPDAAYWNRFKYPDRAASRAPGQTQGACAQTNALFTRQPPGSFVNRFEAANSHHDQCQDWKKVDDHSPCVG